MNFSKIKIFLTFLSLFNIFFTFSNKAMEISDEKVQLLLDNLGKAKEILKEKLGKKELELISLKTLEKEEGLFAAKEYFKGLEKEIQNLKDQIGENEEKIGIINDLKIKFVSIRKTLNDYKNQQASLLMLLEEGTDVSEKLADVNNMIKIFEDGIKIYEKKLKIEVVGREIKSEELPQQLKYEKKFPGIFKGLAKKEKEKLDEIIDSYIDSYSEDYLKSIIDQKEVRLKARLQAIGKAIPGVDVALYRQEAQIFFAGKFFKGERYFIQRGEKLGKLSIGGGYEERELTIWNYINAVNKEEKEDIAKKIIQHYKIHLMPIEQETEEITRKLLKDKTLQPLIHSFKVKTCSEEVLEKYKTPRIIIYASAGKKNVQQLLNKIYELFKNDKGSGRTPRYNEKVTDLIYFAQGDGGDKERPRCVEYYEQPDRIYYKPDFVEIDEDFYLENPAEKFPEIFKGLAQKEKEELKKIIYSYSEDSEDFLKRIVAQKHLINFIRLRAIGEVIPDVKIGGSEDQIFFAGKFFKGKRHEHDELKSFPIESLLEPSQEGVLTIWNYIDEKDKKIKKNIARKIIQHYKIHLMPIEQETEKITRKLLNAIVEDEALQSLIYCFKVKTHQEEVLQERKIPRIVIYAAAGKENAQQLLNKIYELFKNDTGSGLVPRYNEKVTNLIYFAQGDGDYKTDEYSKYYKKPNRVYYKGKFAGIRERFHLKNPAKK